MSSAGFKRLLFILLPMAIAVGAMTSIYFFIKPKIQGLIISQIDRISNEKLPIHLKIKQVDWTLLFPELQLEGISIQSKDPLKLNLPPLEVQKVSASLDLLALFAGRIGISSLLIEKPTLKLNLDPYLNTDGPSQPLPLKDFFELLKKIPVGRLGLKGLNLNLASDKLKFNLIIQSGDLLINNKKDRLQAQFDINESSISYNEKRLVPFRAQGEAILTTKNLDITNLKIGALNSVLTLNGSLNEFQNIHIQPQGSIEYEFFSEIEKTSEAARQFLNLPDMSGSIKTSGRLDLDSKSDLNSGFKFMGQKLKVNQFDIGDLQFEGGFADNQLKISDIALTNESGLIDVKNLILNFKRLENNLSIDLAGKIHSDQVDLNELLQRLGIGDIPIETFISSQLSCQGPIYPSPSVTCQGDLTGKQIEVRTGEKASDVLVFIEEFAAKGEVNINSQNVNYKTTLSLAQDQGASDGVIDYNTGFKINFSSPDLHLENIRRLAGLKLEGHGSISGSTQGDSNAATFSANLSPKSFVFEDFVLGDVSGNLSYRKGNLHFSGIQGQVASSEKSLTKYVANVDVDLNNKKISAQGQLPQFDMNDLLFVFQRRFTMPIELTGTGTATVQVEGPFQLGKLSYDLNAVVSRGFAAGEGFDRAEVSLHSESGEMTVQKARISKNKSEINLTGVSHPNGDISLNIKGQRLPLEESENISKLGTQISGLTDLNMNLTGFILHPDITMNGRIYQLNIEDQEFPESNYSFNLTPQKLTGNADVFSGQLITNYEIPLKDQGPFRLDLKANNWNYTTLFALVGGGGLLNDYRASLNGDLNLSSEQGGLWNATGSGTIRNLQLQRGNLSLKNLAPMTLEMKNGVASLNRFRIVGDQASGDPTFFEVSGNSFSKNNLNLQVKGQANLRLFQIFLPFLDELGGSAGIAIDTSGTLFKPEILGNANIKNGFVKIKGFPHAFEKTQADIQFSQSKILINGFLGDVAGGTFQGDGTVLIEGPRNIPTNIRAHLVNVNFNVPDRIKTSGDADVVFSGSWFPFTLSGTYHVRGGFVDKEFTEGSGMTSLKQSAYLPKMIMQTAFEPILLDINAIIEKPLTIRNSMIDGTATGNMTIKGPPTLPALGGRIVTEKNSKVMFRDKVFDIQTANIVFDGTNEINPELYLSAQSRITEYDINMLVQGNAKNPIIRMSSIPPLPENDIISLIALGITTQKLEKQIESRQRDNTSDQNAAAIGTGLILETKPIKKIQEWGGVQLQLTSNYDDTKNVSVQRITLTKKLSDKVKASATQTQGYRTSKEVSLQYNLTNNWSAIGRYEDRQPSDNAATTDSSARDNQSVFGLDLEYKLEFK